MIIKECFKHLAKMIVIVASLCATLSSCESKKEDEPNRPQDLNVYPWKDYPQSYIKMFDYRMKLQMLTVIRNGSTLQFDYTLTNVGFGCAITLTFYLNKDAGHDNLGNTYICTSSQSDSDVLAYINEEWYQRYMWGNEIQFIPDQTIKGSFTIKNFDINATAFSISVNINKIRPSDITLTSNHMDFVNIPVPESTGDGSGIPMM